MAVIRDAPKCPFCGKIIAEAVYKKREPWDKFCGDDFLRWEYKKHKCKKMKKSFSKDAMKKFNDIVQNIKDTKK